MKTIVATLVLSAVHAGCGGDDPTSPTGASGSLSFGYTGAGATNSSFSASGSIPATIGSDTQGNSLGTNAWAAGSVSPTLNYTIIGASIPHGTNVWDVTSISIARKTVGTSNVDANCDSEATNCTGVFVFFNFNPNGDTFGYLCSLATGTVTISAISSSNITGTFTGSGQCFTSAGATSNFTVTNGSFNVGVTSQLLP